MPNVHLTPQMQDFAEREIATGAFANLSEVVRAGMRKLMEERGAAAFYALKADLESRCARPKRGGEAVRSTGLRAARLQVSEAAPACTSTAAAGDLTGSGPTRKRWGETQWLAYYGDMRDASSGSRRIRDPGVRGTASRRGCGRSRAGSM